MHTRAIRPRASRCAYDAGRLRKGRRLGLAAFAGRAPTPAVLGRAAPRRRNLLPVRVPRDFSPLLCSSNPAAVKGSGGGQAGILSLGLVDISQDDDTQVLDSIDAKYGVSGKLSWKQRCHPASRAVAAGTEDFQASRTRSRPTRLPYYQNLPTVLCT